MNEQGQSCEPRSPGAVDNQGTVDPTTTRAESLPPDKGQDQQNAERKVRDKVEDTKQAAREVGDRLSEKANEIAHGVKEQSQNFLNQQKDRVASEISAYSEAARRAADRLESESDTNLSSYVSSAASHLDRLGKRIQERSLAGLVDDVEDLARQRPEVFYGGLFVVGLAAARFLKASKRERQRNGIDNPGSQWEDVDTGAESQVRASWTSQTRGSAPRAGDNSTVAARPSSTNKEGPTGGNI